MRYSFRLILLPLCFFGVALLSGCASFRYGDDQYQIRVGAHGKDVMWVPSKTELVHLMLDHANVTRTDVLYDLGSGDGIIPIEAAKTRGVRTYGIEYNRELVELSLRNAQRAGVSDLTSFRQGDIFVEDFSRATVVTLYLGENLNLKLKPRLLAMKPGTRIVSNTFRMGTWQPDKEFRSSTGEAGFLWIVPATLDGTWELLDATNPLTPPARLFIRQTKQYFRGAFTSSAGRAVGIESGSIKGNDFTFEISTPTENKRVIFGAFEGNGLRLYERHGDGRSSLVFLAKRVTP
nr:Release factor glutamine methyltransferase [Cupriavidus sp.]